MQCYAMLCYVAIDCLYLFTLTRGFSPFVVWKRLTSIARPQHRNSGKPQSELFFFSQPHRLDIIFYIGVSVKFAGLVSSKFEFAACYQM
jgi:hypothetical protein